MHLIITKMGKDDTDTGPSTRLNCQEESKEVPFAAKAEKDLDASSFDSSKAMFAEPMDAYLDRISEQEDENDSWEDKSKQGQKDNQSHVS